MADWPMSERLSLPTSGVPIPTEPPTAGHERTELVAALKLLVTHAQAFNARGQTAATVRVLQCFDAMRERSDGDSIELSGELVDRLRSAYAFGVAKKFLAVRVDVEDVADVLAIVDGASEMATETAAADASPPSHRSDGATP